MNEGYEYGNSKGTVKKKKTNGKTDTNRQSIPYLTTFLFSARTFFLLASISTDMMGGITPVTLDWDVPKWDHVTRADP